MSSPPHSPPARAVATTESRQSRDSPRTDSGAVGATVGPVLLGLAVLVVAGAAGPVAASSGPVAFDHDSPDCDGDSRDRNLEERAGEVAFVDTLVDDSTADWDGGRIVRVGASGDCSLAVTNGTATLTAATVDAPGVVTGTVDLGENGSLRLVGPPGTARIALENDGPAYATSIAVVTNRSVSDRIETSTGRFVAFTVRRYANGTARLAVWDPDETWDGNWDVRLDGATTGDRWRVRLRAEVFVDEIAIGTPTPAPTETEDDPFSGEDSEFSTPDFEDDQIDDGGAGTSDDGLTGGGAAFLAIIMVVGGGLGFRFAYALSQFEERIDAIGSTTPWHEVEPADWKVLLNRLIFGGIAVLGALWLLTLLV